MKLNELIDRLTTYKRYHEDVDVEVVSDIGKCETIIGFEEHERILRIKSHCLVCDKCKVDCNYRRSDEYDEYNELDHCLAMK
jgi:hypothetical protein